MIDRLKRGLDLYLRRKNTIVVKGLRRISSEEGEHYRSSQLKRAMDIGIALPLWMVTLPVQGIARGLVWLEDNGKTTYIDSNRFALSNEDARSILPVRKIRSMKINADSLQVPINLRNTQKDSRLTKVGKIIRRLNIDELPQLWQVVRGQMTLIGPRAVREDEIYGSDGSSGITDHPSFKDWEIAYQGRPGILDPRAAIYGRDRKGGEIRLRVNADIFYAKKASLGLDLYLLTRFLLGIRRRRYRSI